MHTQPSHCVAGVTTAFNHHCISSKGANMTSLSAVVQGTAILKGGKDLESADTDSTDANAALVQSRLVSPLRYAVCNIITIPILGNLILIPLSYMLISLPLFTMVMVAVYEGSGVLVAPAVLMGFTLNFTLNTIWQACAKRWETMLPANTLGCRKYARQNH